MGELQTRRAIIQGMGTKGHYQTISAQIPLSEMYKYCFTLRSLSQGRAKFTSEFSEYMPMTDNIQKKVIGESEIELIEV